MPCGSKLRRCASLLGEWLLGSDQQHDRRLDRGEIRDLAAVRLRDHGGDAGGEGRAVVGQPALPGRRREAGRGVARSPRRSPSIPPWRSAAQAAISAASSPAAAKGLYPVTTSALTRSG